jgi:hypothetical protein
LCQELPYRPRPDEFFLFGEAFRRLPAGQGTELTTVISDARASAWVDRLIVWDYSEDTLPRAAAPGGMATGSSWVLDAVSGREGTAPSWFTPIACWVLGVDQPESAPPALAAAGTDAVMSRLGSRWRLVSDESYEIRVHWNWSLRGSCRRREYVRAPLESPTSQPATTSRPRP